MAEVCEMHRLDLFPTGALQAFVLNRKKEIKKRNKLFLS